MAMSYQEERVLRQLAGRAAIADLDARLNRAQESGDVRSWLAGFLPEGSLIEPGLEPWCGHHELGSYLRSLPSGRIYVSTDSTTEVDGVNARHQASFLVLKPGSNGSALVIEASGRRCDDLVYERGGWYVARRQNIPFASEP